MAFCIIYTAKLRRLLCDLAYVFFPTTEPLLFENVALNVDRDYLCLTDIDSYYFKSLIIRQNENV